jgi:hypothetical protein
VHPPLDEQKADEDGEAACGADDVALYRPKFKNGRFQMIDDRLDQINRK